MTQDPTDRSSPGSQSDPAGGARDGSLLKRFEEMSDEELLAAVARRVVGMRLAVPAVFFLESTKPLSFLGSQLLIFLQPFVQAFLTVRSYERFSHLMEERENVEALIQKMEQLDEELRLEEKQRKAQDRKRKQEERARRGESTRRWPWQR